MLRKAGLVLVDESETRMDCGSLLVSGGGGTMDYIVIIRSVSRDGRQGTEKGNIRPSNLFLRVIV